MKEFLVGILVVVTMPIWVALIAITGVVMLLHNMGKGAIELVEDFKK